MVDGGSMHLDWASALCILNVVYIIYLNSYLQKYISSTCHTHVRISCLCAS